MRPLRAFTLRHSATLTLIFAALIAVLGSGLSPVSSSEEISGRLSARGDRTALTTLPNANDTGIKLNPLAGANQNERSDEFNLRLRSASIASPFAAALTATKTDNISTPVNPGDTIMYTVEITNTGDVAATNVNFTDTIDANTTLVAGSVAVAPIAVNDAYNTIGNVNIQVPVGQGVIANDLNPQGSGTLSVTLVNATPVPGTAATTNGSVTMGSDGSFSYTPNAGFSGPTDTFTYTLSNSATPGKTDTATVTIAVAGRIWFVNSAAGVNGDGRLNTPFNILTGAGSADSVDAANDVIFLYSSGTNYTGGITLNSGEKIIGQGASQTILAITGFATPSGNNLLPATGGSDPVIVTAGTVAITLGTNNGLHGFTVGNTGAAGTDIAGTSFGTLTVRDVTVNGTGRALNLATGTIAAASTFDLIETTGGDNNEGARLNAVGGSFTAPTTNIVNPTGTGLDVQSSPAGTSFSFGATTVNKGATAGTGVNLNANSGTFSFSSLAVTTSNGTGVSATSSGTVNVTTGSIASTGGPALVVNPTTLGMTFTSVTSTNSTTTGISLTSASGSLTIATTTINNPTGIGISATSSSATLSFGTTVVNNSGGTGVVLGGIGTGNTGAISFGDLDIDPDNNVRCLLAQDNTMLITATSGTINATGAIAVEITRSSSTTPLAIGFTRVDSSTATSGIILTNTSGSFSVAGNGGDVTLGGNGTGGTITGTTGPGVNLSNVSNISFTSMMIVSGGDDGIRGLNVTGFTVNRCSVLNNGNAVTERGLEMTNLLGTASITNSLVTGNAEDNLYVKNGTGTLSLTTSATTYANTSAAIGNDGIHFLGADVSGSNNANMTIHVTSCIFTNNRGDHFQALTDAVSTATQTIVFQNNDLNNTVGTNLGAGLTLNPGGTATVNFNISNNGTALDPFTGAFSSAITINSSNNSTMSGTINNNIIGSAGVTDSGSFSGDGITVFANNTSDITIAITNNTIRQYSNLAGISIHVRDGVGDTLNATITGNTISNPGTFASHGILAQAGSAGGDTGFLCADIGGAGALANSLVGSGANGGTDFRVRQRMSTTVRLPGYGGATTDTAAVVSFIQGRNNGAETGSATVQSPPGGGYVGGAACAAAANPMSVMPEMSASSADAVADEPAAVEIADQETLRTAPGEGPYDDNLQKLNKEELGRMVQAAVERLGQSGISPEDLARLQAVSFEVADLPTGQISTGDSNLIKIDETAAGYGWYFDQFPMEDSEFGVLVPNKELQTFDLSPAHGQMDLLTVVMRELGRVYLQGKDRVSKGMRKNLQPLMEGSLSPSVRRLTLDQLRLIVPSTTGSIKPRIDDGLMARSRAIPQPDAIQTGNQPVFEQVESSGANARSNGSKIPAEARFAVFNPSEGLTPGDYGRSAKRMSYARNARPVSPFSGETINLGPFTIPPGEKIVIMFSATVNAANTFPPGTTQVCNQGTVSATGIPAFLTDDPDVAGSNNPTCTALNVADVSVTKSAGSSPVCSTSNITFTINYSNAGPAAALDALVSDAMPAGTSLVSVTTPATWTRTDLVPIGGNGTITFTKASSPNADAAVFTIVVSINAGVTDGTVIQNTASVTSTTPDPNTANNTTTPTSTTVKTPPTATAGGPQTICATGTTAGLGGNTPPAGQTGTWSIVTAGVVGTFNPNANAPNATFTHTSGPGPFTLRWTVSNPPCTDATADVVISLLPAPVATTGGPQTICELGTTASLGGNTPAAGETGAWSIVTAGVTGTFNPDANTPGATFTHVSGGAGGTITLRWTVTNPTCGQSATADAIITVNQQPTATVGGPQTICALGTTAGLGGNTPAGGATGTWTIVTAGATGTFTPNANTANATFTHTAGTGMITLRWTVSNPPCTDAFAEVIITINPAPAATAGGPQTICALGTTAGLGGNTPTGGATGTWTIVTAGATGTFNPNANTPDATFTHTAGTGTITLRWTVSNPPCVDATADVAITITQPPTTATVGPNQTILPLGTTAGLGGNTPTSGTGMWSIVTAGATGTFNPNATTPNATWTHATGSGVIVLRWTITNPPCPDSFAEVSIQVGVPPMITCPPSPVVVNTAPGQCSATVKFEVTATGTPTPTVTCVPPSGSVFPKGNTTVNCTAANGIPPDATCSFTVTVNDNQPPAITCPANITQSTDPNQCSAVVTYPAPTVTDNCPCNEARTKKQRLSGLAECQVVCIPASGSTFPKGTTTVTCTATDVSGNQAMCSFTVTVNDTQPPAITCPPNITVKAAQAGDPCVVVNFPTPVATDNCPDPTVVCTPPSGTCFPLGTTTVTCTATDGSGNTASCTFKVTAFDLCLQDDSNPNTVLLINSVTGDYVFCCGGMTFTGKGTISKSGSTYKLTHNATDRRVLATDDETQHKGTATLQSPPGVTKCTITDRNTLNNSCNCGGG